ncbi:hypothetical protein [Streptomyces sp. NPDC005953]|uniref:hypothetical protein n=1 Tax=Streptomyces sp. NPDC005953 TaxID=3156719 RepID=UPI0033F4FE69
MSRWDDVSEAAKQLIYDLNELDIAESLASRNAAADRVRALHERVTNQHVDVCTYCSARDYPAYEVPWPCDTIRALDNTEEP